MRAASSSVEAPKAAIMVVGDEILAGSITDTNTPWLAKLLHRWASSQAIAHDRVHHCGVQQCTSRPESGTLLQRCSMQCRILGFAEQ